MSRYAANGGMYWAGIVNKNDQFFVELRAPSRGRWTVIKSKEAGFGFGQIRFDTRGSQLRVYMNGRLMLKATDRVLARGLYPPCSPPRARK